ncbi:MAG: hypothetical protein ABI867_09815 [Kofleriaceae bacterium]
MQKLPVGVAISLAFHAVAIACVVGFVTAADDVPILDRQSVTVEVIDLAAVPSTPPPMQVALLDDPPAAALPAELPAPRVVPSAKRDAIATPGAATAVTAETGPPITTTEPVQPNRYYTMRGNAPRRVDLSIRPGFRDDLDHAPKGATPAREVEETGKLQPNGGGTYRSDEGVFTAKVARDGSVDLKDSKNLRIHVVLSPRRVGKAVTDWAKREDKTPNDPDRVAVNNNRPVDKDTRPDHGQATVPIVGGGFDVTDALLRRKGQDPYFSKKLKYLDSTRDERVQIGTRYKAQLLKQSTQLMQRNLENLFARTQDPAARKRGMFELWDDCAETGEPAVIEAGGAARKLALGTIRSRFPAAGADAFTPQELAALNAHRHSKTVFAPYE